MTTKEITKIIQDIYEWPLEECVILKVYKNLTNLLKSDYGLDVIEYFDKVISLDRKDRRTYRNVIANKGFELRPDELDQYILILMIVMDERVEV
jgi:hypothetical protein